MLASVAVLVQLVLQRGQRLLQVQALLLVRVQRLLQLLQLALLLHCQGLVGSELFLEHDCLLGHVLGELLLVVGQVG